MVGEKDLQVLTNYLSNTVEVLNSLPNDVHFEQIEAIIMI